MFNKSKFTACNSLLLLLLSTLPARAVIAVTNFPNSDGGHEDPFGTEYTSFTTSSLPAILNSVAVRVNISHISPLVPQLAASIRTDVGGNPGPDDLETFPTLSNLFGFVGDITFSSAGLALAPNTTYWFRLDVFNSQAPRWFTTDLNTETSPYGWTIGDGSGFFDPSVGWHPHRYTGRITVDATLLPDPSTPLAAVAVCGLALPLTRRRR